MNRQFITKILLSLKIDLPDFNAACELIISKAKKKEKGFVCFANVHMLIEAHRNNFISDAINNSFLTLPDGMPIVKSMGSLFNIKCERVAGMDIFPVLLNHCEKENLSVFFFGTTNELLKKIKAKAIVEFPKLKIAGAFSPPFNKQINDPSYIDLINKASPDMVFVALGCPKQELWMNENYSNINSLLLGVGGAFPVYAQSVKRAPEIFRKLSLEWLFRLFQEPRRLFKRYFYTNTYFILLYSRLKLKLLFSSENG